MTAVDTFALHELLLGAAVISLHLQLDNHDLAAKARAAISVFPRLPLC
jgi:hypothetical protein